MEKIQENICKQACSYVFVQENYIKAHVLMYFLHSVLTFTPHYIIMVKGLLEVTDSSEVTSNDLFVVYSYYVLYQSSIGELCWQCAPLNYCCYTQEPINLKT